MGVVTDQRLYRLVRQSAPISDYTFAIEFLDPGVEAKGVMSALGQKLT